METLKEKLKFLRTCDTSFVADALVRLGLGAKIPELTIDNTLCAPLNREDHFAGVAVPVQFAMAEPNQKTWTLFDLISTCPADSVLIMAGCEERCYFGDVYAKYAKIAGIEAFVAEGCVRDIKDIASCGLPTFCRGGTTAAKGGNGAKIVSYDQPIQFHHATIRPGDILVGDADGIIIVPEEYLEAVLFQVEDIKRLEAEYLQVFREGTDILPRLRAIGAKKDVLRV